MREDAGNHFAARVRDPLARGDAYELRASFFLAHFAKVLDRPAQHELPLAASHAQAGSGVTLPMTKESAREVLNMAKAKRALDAAFQPASALTRRGRA